METFGQRRARGEDTGANKGISIQGPSVSAYKNETIGVETNIRLADFGTTDIHIVIYIVGGYPPSPSIQLFVTPTLYP